MSSSTEWAWPSAITTTMASPTSSSLASARAGSFATPAKELLWTPRVPAASSDIKASALLLCGLITTATACLIFSSAIMCAGLPSTMFFAASTARTNPIARLKRIAAIRFRRAIGFVRAVEAAKNIVLGRPAHIIADEKIKQAVAVVIKPQSRSAEALMSEEAAGTRGVHKSSFAGVAKEPALADASDEDVGEAIVVVIADGHAHSVELDIEARAARYVGECAVVIVAVKPKSGTLAFVAGPVPT